MQTGRTSGPLALGVGRGGKGEGGKGGGARFMQHIHTKSSDLSHVLTYTAEANEFALPSLSTDNDEIRVRNQLLCCPTSPYDVQRPLDDGTNTLSAI